ncbi:MAG TPA: long-chain-fatty-acid--CoA ligase [Candidatus Limnocylindria bacterium]|nr:long-chain-fatty-acid--CoA ligase [Candidatus Limnocylindria bacterium]
MLLIGEIVRRRAHGPDADRVALLFNEHRWTYGELDEAAVRLANGLRTLGVERGDRVALLGRNSVEWVVAYFAVAKAGAVLVPVSYWYKAAELRHVLADSGARVLIAAADHADVAADAAGSTTVVWIGEHDGGIRYADLIASSSDAEPAVAIAETDPHVILYTSGTTGAPKGAVLSHRAHVLHAAMWASETRATRDDVYLCTYPLFHTGGTDCGILPPLYAGATVVVLPWPDVDAILDAIERHRVTAFRAVPTIWKRLVAHADLERRDLSSLRRVIAGSDAMPRELIDEIRARLPHAAYLQNYGLTEAGPVLTFLRPEDPPSAYGSNGRPHPQAEIRIVDDQDRPVPPGTVGEIVARSEHLMDGYWNLPDRTEEALRGGWLHTGDLGMLDDDGYLWVTGRKKDVIITGSEHVSPLEVEAVLRLHPDVEEVAVFGIPDAQWGESVVAAIIPAAGRAPDPEQLRAFVRERLADFKRPRYIVFTDELPRTGPTRKIQKTVLRERYRELARAG